jgi:tRNA-2-methylthio-N6-dimethylallyladenosine synthase
MVEELPLTLAKSFFIRTFGCQMNAHDSSTLAGLLTAAGHRQVGSAEEADIILLNTCTVRDKADQKVYSQLGRYRLLKLERPEMIIGVGGCMAQGEGRRVLSRAPFVDLVFGTQTLHRVAEMIDQMEQGRRKMVWIEMDQPPEALDEFYANSRAEGHKAFITVMQGCENHCAYCIVPTVRGREVSRPADEIVAEAARLAAQGVVEVTLLGQNVNSYGLKGSTGVNFPELVRRVTKVEGVERLRFTTSHPKDLSDELIALFAQEPKLMTHIHLPLQAGSDRILKLMNRRYTFGHYLGLVEKLRAAVPGIALSSDMIVGFPGETEEDFEGTLEAMRKVEYDFLFSFKYSPRRGTPAAEMEGQVPDKVKEERLARLQELQKAHTLKLNRAQVGSVRAVMVDGRSRSGGGQLMGRTPENKIVNFTGPAELVTKTVEVEIIDAYINSMTGRLVQ